MSVSHLSSMDLFPFTCNTLGFLPIMSCKTIWCREGAPSPCWDSSSLQALLPSPFQIPEPCEFSPNNRSFSCHFPGSSVFSRTILHEEDSDKCWGSRLPKSLWGGLRGADSIYAQLWDQCISWLAFLLLRKDQWRKDQLEKDRWWPDKPLIHKKRDFAWRNRTLPWGSSSDLIVPKSYRLTWVPPAINCQPCKDRVRMSPLLDRATHTQSNREENQGRVKS